MEKIVTYDDWIMLYDSKTDKYYAVDEEGVFECELVSLIEDSDRYSETELLNGIETKDFDFSGEYDEPIVETHIEGDVRKFNYKYKYGYWKNIRKLTKEEINQIDVIDEDFERSWGPANDDEED